MEKEGNSTGRQGRARSHCVPLCAALLCLVPPHSPRVPQAELAALRSFKRGAHTFDGGMDACPVAPVGQGQDHGRTQPWRWLPFCVRLPPPQFQFSAESTELAGGGTTGVLTSLPLFLFAHTQAFTLSHIHTHIYTAARRFPAPNGPTSYDQSSFGGAALMSQVASLASLVNRHSPPRTETILKDRC